MEGDGIINTHLTQSGSKTILSEAEGDEEAGMTVNFMNHKGNLKYKGGKHKLKKVNTFAGSTIKSNGGKKAKKVKAMLLLI